MREEFGEDLTLSRRDDVGSGGDFSFMTGFGEEVVKIRGL